MDTNPFASRDVFEITDVDDHNDYESFLSTGASLRVVAEPYGPEGQHVLKPDAGDFVKWLKSHHPSIKVDAQDAQKLVLHSADIWVPLVFLAKDVSLPLFLNLVSDYLFARLRGALRGESPRVHLSAEYTDPKTGSVKRFVFEGNHEALKSAIKRFDLNAFMHGE